MQKTFVHEIELYSLESFKILLEHEINRSRRYKNPLTLMHLAIETDPGTPQAQHSAEMFVINTLDLHLRNTDIPCRKGNEFLILLPATAGPGVRIACDRLANLLNVTQQLYDRVSFQLSVFIGVASSPGDRHISSDRLMQQAALALAHARKNHSLHPVEFSDLNENEF